MRHLLRLLLLGVVLGIVGMLWYSYALGPIADESKSVQIDIPNGMSTTKIAELLEEKGLIRSAAAFRLYVRLHDLAGTMHAGRFVLDPAKNAKDIADVIASLKQSQMSVTIPEGYTVLDIDALLVRKGLTQTGAFLKCAQICDFSKFTWLPKVSGAAKRGGKVEGYLFPDTYFVNAAAFDSEEFLKRLLKEFETRVVEGLSNELTASNRTLADIVILASLLEEESRRGEERSVIAGILWKRLDERTGLGVDATIRYVLDKPRAALTSSDLAVDSPYNTRKYRGLPPSPIANPGLSSVTAALKPTASAYYYYLHDNDGGVHYGRTNDEHNQNKAKYLR